VTTWACAPEPAPTTAPESTPAPEARAAPASPAREFASETIIGEGRSEYNHVQVTQEGSLRRMYFVRADGRRLLQSTYDLDRPDQLDHEVFQTMISALLVQPKVERLLMVGVGGAQVTNYLYGRIEGLEIDAVDICPEVVRLAREHFGVPDSPRYRMHVDDGRVFIEDDSHGLYDLLVLDAFRGHSIPVHLRSREFFQACRDRLAPGGVMVVNMHRRAARYPNDRSTLASVFPTCYRFTSPDDVQTSVVCSTSEAVLSVEALQIAARTLQPRFDIDLSALATRVVVGKDWEGGEVLHDEFGEKSLEDTAREQNLSCQPNCARDQ
jgi:spermidine synthase